jgi:hypothetical protein
MLPPDEYPTRLVVDTNALIAITPTLPHTPTPSATSNVVHLLPIVLGELDDLKRAGHPVDLIPAGLNNVPRNLK